MYANRVLSKQRLRQAEMNTCRESRDPRFDSLSGTLDTSRFRKRYSFLYDEQLPAEREDIKSSLQVPHPLSSVLCSSSFLPLSCML